MKLYGSQAGWYFFVNDHLGMPQKIVDASGSVVWAGFYLPFGKALAYPATIVNNFRFPGQYYDAETGLHYNWHRYYDPETGRYITADPIGLEGGVNLYVYVRGNPANLTDSDGLDAAAIPWWETVIITGGEGGASIGVGGIAFIVGGILHVTATPAGEGSDIIPGSSSINKDGTVDDSAGIDNDCDKKGKWKCEGYSQYDQIGTPKHVRRGSTLIIAYGKTEALARDAWIKKAQNAAPRGFTARHILQGKLCGRAFICRNQFSTVISVFPTIEETSSGDNPCASINIAMILSFSLTFF